MNVHFDRRTLVRSVVSRVRDARKQAILSDRLRGLGVVSLDIRRCLAQSMESASAARDLGDFATRRLFRQKAHALKACLEYVAASERKCISQACGTLGFTVQPVAFATPTWSTTKS